MAGIGTGISCGADAVANTYRWRTGEYDTPHYAAAMTVDTGINLGSAFLGGVIGGATVGLLVGTAVAPGVGTVAGIVVGAGVGLAAALIMDQHRDYVVEEVADMYVNGVFR